jgi:3-hydroxybutyryl-CoA dehydrogenase
MEQTKTEIKVAIIGAGAMGRGIAQIAATAGHRVMVYDSSDESIDNARNSIDRIMARLIEKKRIEKATADAIISRISYCQALDQLSEADIAIEAIVEDLEVKKNLFEHLELIVDDEAILASNTSSLSIASICAACTRPERVLGIHFFNPAPLMPLVEIIPAVQTSGNTLVEARNLIDSWGKTTVIAKDTPGFIVNRVARPFYGEALRILEEGIADPATIDWAMRTIGQFKMGPFELMDYIGNDVNYAVTESVFEAFFYDPRYKPSFTQKRMVEAGWLGRKSGRGYYDYKDGKPVASPDENQALGNEIVERILFMLINEAADALHLNIASREGIDMAMTKGVNYPKGLLKWADEIGVGKVLKGLENLQDLYGEDRYRPSVLLKRMVLKGEKFYMPNLLEN